MPYSIAKIDIFYGAPPVPVVGLHYIFARHNVPQTRLIMSLNSSGVFAGNNNKSGIIEMGIMNGSLTCAGFQLMDTTGIPFPIIAVDRTSGGSSQVVASACRRVNTPEWRRAALPGIDIYTFETPRLYMFDGLRIVEE